MESTSSQRFVREHDKIGWKNTTANANIGGVQYPFVNKKSSDVKDHLALSPKKQYDKQMEIGRAHV